MPKKQSKIMNNETETFFLDLKAWKAEAILSQTHARRGVRVE